MINTTLCYLEKNSSYLMLHRIKKKNDCNHDKWIGIGGKFEEGESPEDCVRREVLEETGLTLGKLEYRGIVTFVSKTADGVYYELMHLFWSDDFAEADCHEDKVKKCDEGVLEWIPKDKMNELPHWQGDEIFLKLIDQKAPFFSLKLIYENDKLKKAVLNEQKLPL